MIRNYFYLLRNAKELNALLRGRKIIDIYTQEKNKLFFQLNEIKDECETLVISADFQRPYIYLKKNHHKAKKNVAEFCLDILPLEINGFSISINDRVIKLSTSAIDIFLLVRGPKTNVLFVKQDEWIKSFKKKGDEEEIKLVVNEINLNEFTLDEKLYYKKLTDEFGSSTIDEAIEKSLRKKFPQINKEILLQLHTRSSQTIAELLKILDEIIYGEIAVVLTNEKKVKLFPANWIKETEQIEEQFITKNFNEALNKYISLNYKFSSFSRLYSEIEKKLNRDLEYFSNKLNNLKSRIERGRKDEEYRKKADLLMANLHLVKKGMKEIVLNDFDTGEEIAIKLDEKTSPVQNAEKYYEKANDEKTEFEKSKQLLAVAKEKYDELLEIKRKLVSIDDVKSLRKIKEKLKLEEKTKRENIGETIKYRKFLIDGKYTVFVGKDAKSNDGLTFKFAKQNDLWFHARGVSGSHVVLRIENTKEAVPKSVLKNVASIAAYFSKAKTSGLVPVAYTFRKFVHKKKGMPPGQVTISRETVLIVPPEIPKNTEEIYD